MRPIAAFLKQVYIQRGYIVGCVNCCMSTVYNYKKSFNNELL